MDKGTLVPLGTQLELITMNTKIKRCVVIIITFVSKHFNCQQQQQFTYLHSRSRCARASAVAVDVGVYTRHAAKLNVIGKASEVTFQYQYEVITVST